MLNSIETNTYYPMQATNSYYPLLIIVSSQSVNLKRLLQCAIVFYWIWFYLVLWLLYCGHCPAVWLILNYYLIFVTWLNCCFNKCFTFNTTSGRKCKHLKAQEHKRLAYWFRGHESSNSCVALSCLLIFLWQAKNYCWFFRFECMHRLWGFCCGIKSQNGESWKLPSWRQHHSSLALPIKVRTQTCMF
jgi:hypothetical protein